jgi:hypothetical protein
MADNYATYKADVLAAAAAAEASGKSGTEFLESSPDLIQRRIAALRAAQPEISIQDATRMLLKVKFKP